MTNPIERSDTDLAQTLGDGARAILAGEKPDVLSGLAGRDQLRRAGLLLGPAGRERLTERARRVAALVRQAKQEDRRQPD